MPFSSLGLSPILLKNIEKQDYKSIYPIQEQAIPAILKKQDVLGIAKTGSGKTASYVLPLLHQLEGSKPAKNRHIKALILVPTRELAVQVGEVVDLFSEGLSPSVKSLAVYGGVSINPQMIKLQGVQLLIATPGRLIDLVESKAISLSEVETLVLDEADKMLNLGFQEEVNKIISLCPNKRQNILFSATLSEEIENITQLVLHQPIVIKIDEDENTIDKITISMFTTYRLIEKKSLTIEFIFINSLNHLFGSFALLNQPQSNQPRAAVKNWRDLTIPEM